MDKVFKENPGLKKYHETSDGVKFFTENNARAHARSLKDKKIKEVGRSPLTSKEGTKQDLSSMQAAKLRAEAINEMDSVEEVEKALEGETAKSVKKAGAKRIASIMATDALNSKENENVKNS